MVLASLAVEDGQEEYGSPAELLAVLDEAIIAPAMARHAELLAQRARDLRVRRAADFLPRS